MTPSPARLVAAGIALVVALWLGYKLANGLYFEKAATLTAGIEKWSGYLDDVRGERDVRTQTDAELQAFIDTTLGGDDEQVTHELRRRLNQIAESIGLADPFVNSTVGRGVQSPARRSQLRDLPADLRDEIDLVEMQGSLKGEGTFEQALRVVHMIDAQPWPHRIDQVRLDPDAEGETFTISLRVTTAYLPGAAPGTPLAAVTNPGGFERWAGLISTNPFQLAAAAPPPVVDPEPEPTISAPPPPTFAYEQWAITGVIEARAGPEVWLLNSQTGDSRIMAVGDHLDEVQLAGTRGDAATFRHGEQVFLVAIGQNLTQRTPVEGD